MFVNGGNDQGRSNSSSTSARSWTCNRPENSRLHQLSRHGYATMTCSRLLYRESLPQIPKPPIPKSPSSQQKAAALWTCAANCLRRSSIRNRVAAFVANKVAKGKLPRKDQRRMNVLLRNTAKREGQPTSCGARGQVVVESTGITGFEDDCLALATTFPVVPEAVVNGKGTASPTSIVQSIEHHPKAGKSLMIRTRAEPHYILTIENGELRPLSKPTLGGGSFWHCVKKSGWHTFRNSVTGTYLSHDGQGKLSAGQTHQKMYECFVTERHESGGYVLVMRHGDELSQVAISELGKRLIEQREGGTAWGFIEAKYVCSSVVLTYCSM